jgi:hypothetical protein
MRGRLLVALVLLAVAPRAARADDPEIEIEPDPPTPPVTPEAPAADPAQPEPIAKDPKVARKWLATAQQLVQRGDYFTSRKKPDDGKVQYENALIAYGKALEAGDDVNVHYEVGLVEEKLGKLPEAARQFRVVVKATAGAKPDIQKKASAKFDDLVPKIGQITLAAKPDDATIAMNGVELGKGPLPETLILLPGTYKFTFSADGFQPKEIEVAIEPGSESERTVELEGVKIIIDTAPKPADDVDQPPPAPPPSRLALYIGGGATVGLVTVGTIAGLLALGQHGTFTAEDSRRGEREDARTSGQRLARITDGALLGAVAAGAFTVYWYRYKYRPALRKYEAETPAKVTVAPWVQSQSGGLTVLGRF